MADNYDMVIDRKRLRKKVTFWRIAAVVIGVILLFSFFGKSAPGVRPYVARVSIEGIILENRHRDEIIAALAEDNQAKALIVHINSPGGSTTGSEELYHAIRKVAGEKPVAITMGTVAASGGYITAIAGDRIFARETTITGSIGVIMQYTRFGGLMDKLGIDSEQVKSGKMKGEPNGKDPISPEARKVFQAMIDDSYDWFVELVSARRGIDMEKTRKISDGRVYTGRQAIALGLIDSIGAESEARDWLAEEHDISTDLPVIDVDKSPKERLLEELMSSIWGKTPFNKALSLDGLLTLWQPNTY